MKKLFLKKNSKGNLQLEGGTIEDLVHMIKSKIPEPFEKDVAYIICPEINCNGFYEDNMQCIRMSKDYGPVCPKKDEAYRIHLCYNEHHIKVPVNESQWKRLDCECGSCVFQSGTNYWRIAKEDYEDWVKENEK